MTYEDQYQHLQTLTKALGQAADVANALSNEDPRAKMIAHLAVNLNMFAHDMWSELATEEAS